uniref:Dihydrolipoamide acetyltransferase component of pyruvate dehydrogenase complex n=1 Tax=Shewanella livingstonensis TaxID=150120 RepID=H1ADJ4_9GAMM|nr:dihydrolipoamide acyltransferase SucB [Shewanella livingstonensis]
MSIEIKVPVLPESVADATIATWHVKPGEQVTRDQNLVDIETDKVVLEVVAPEDGSISELLFQEGDTVLGEQVIANFVAGVVSGQEVTKAEASGPAVVATTEAASDESNDALSPSVRRVIAEHNLDASKIKGSGVGGRVTKDDVDAFLKSAPAKAAAPAAPVAPLEGRSEKRVPMSRLRKTIAKRLLEAKNSTAMLTTFNEVNMKPIMDIRKQYQDIFEKRHGIRLGFMSFYIKAVTEALKRFPEVNASIDGDDIACCRSTLEDPLLNLPQSAILGMHAIKDRPMAVNGQVEILPMMYLALSYDHRIVDGRESVGFLVAIKDFLEDPTRLLLDL